MTFSAFIKALKMFYLLLCYVTSLFSLICHLLWLFCTMASTGIPWATFLLIIVCVGSKFVKLKSPSHNYLIKLFGDDNLCELSSKKSIFWPIAHRGASFDAPENSAAALKKCVALNCGMVMLDLDITSCGELVILHRTTLDKANIKGQINNMTYESLQNFSINDFHPLGTQYQPEKILSFANLITLLENLDLTVFLLISPSAGSKCINTIKSTLKSNETITKKLIFCSNSAYTLYQLRKHYPEIVCGLWINKTIDYGKKLSPPTSLLKSSTLIMSIYAALFRNIIVPVIGISVVFLNKDEYNAHIQRLWKNVGVRPIIYSVNSPSEKSYFQKVLRTQYLTDSLRSEPQLLVKSKNI